MNNINIQSYSPLALAYVGDGIFEILVRTHIAKKGPKPVNTLHKLAKEYVSAESQSKIIEGLLPHLSEKETEFFKRGRNAKSHTVSKNAALIDYKRATGMECLFGYLHLTGQDERIKEIFEMIVRDKDEQNSY